MDLPGHSAPERLGTRLNLFAPPPVQMPHLPQQLAAAEVPAPTIAIVVCTYRRPRELERCLRSLRRQTLQPTEIVVVDNAPAASGARALAEAAGARYVAAPVRGVSRARNAGARQCASAIVAYIDDDMVAHRDWLLSVRSAFADPQVIAVTGPVMPMPLANAPRADLLRELRCQPWGADPFHVARDCADWFERAHFGGLGDGNMAFRRAAFDEWRGFEERIGRGAPVGGGEEHYAFFELLERGHRISYQPAAIVFHPLKERAHEEHLRSIAETAAYSCFVATSRPRFAWRVLRYLLQGALRRRRAWRPASDAPLARRVSTFDALAALVQGTAAYARSRREAPARTHPRPVRRSGRRSQEATTR